MFKMVCKNCEKELGFLNIRRLEDLDCEKIGVFCTECFPTAEAEVKALRFAEEYKGTPIYVKNGKFGLWGANYYFKSLEDARTRIDNRHIAYVDTNALRFMFEQMK
ncbi:hypothetical protein [Paenibacillus polymyxa]|uniref:Uncharacterized protein n=1 Tax=Paenibacillus polymyxa TaxID=1406 RepID=A0ABX2ZAF2_PAEPO|nr:hypothetical protein [Paenibacillus polymyxa]ODA08266.1 hypothetical protein A7312_27760 [Paenibacillus polymyxa]